LPIYYGAFIRKDLIDYIYDQKSPLHVTSAYVGGNYKTYMSLPVAVHNALGLQFEIIIKHLHVGVAGNALIVDSLAPCDAEPRIMHITLKTNANFKPADVGKELFTIDAIGEPIDKKINSIYALTW